MTLRQSVQPPQSSRSQIGIGAFLGQPCQRLASFEPGDLPEKTRRPFAHFTDGMLERGEELLGVGPRRESREVSSAARAAVCGCWTGPPARGTKRGLEFERYRTRGHDSLLAWGQVGVISPKGTLGELHRLDDGLTALKNCQRLEALPTESDRTFPAMEFAITVPLILRRTDNS
jgi:hypothetical protein